MTPTPSSVKFDADPNGILLAEYNYIAQTAFQANEDRARVSSYFFVTAAAVIGAILSAKLEAGSATGVYLAFALLFAILSAIGLTTLLQLARLRTSWQDSARAMNVIKDYYIQNCREADLSAAFLWRMPTIPQAISGGHNRRTVSFLLAVSVWAISFGTATATIVYLFLALAPDWQNWIGVAAGLFGATVFAHKELRAYESWILDAERSQHERVKEHYDRFKDLLP